MPDGARTTDTEADAEDLCAGDAAEEDARLREVNRRSLPARILGYARLTGPGYIQSALTLGAGTASACLLSGWRFGYKLLWVQPLAMLLGVIVFAAIAKQTLNSNERPYEVFWKRLHPLMALAWGVSALLASMFWHIAQYGIAVSSLADLGQTLGMDNANTLTGKWIIGLATLATCIPLSWAYSRRGLPVRTYELLIKITVWGMVIAFGYVAIATGIKWDELGKGLCGFWYPKPSEDLEGFWILVGGLGAAVGVNMVFLYPYSLRQRNWGRHHEGLAQYDLLSGMFLPFTIATSFVIIATANTISADGLYPLAEKPKSMVHLMPILSQTMGTNASAVLLGVGLFAMGWSSITVQMVAAGFTATEILGWKSGGWAHRLCMLLPAPVGIWGSVTTKPLLLAVYVSVGMVVFLPLAYIGFFILNNKKSYLGETMPRGRRRWLWNIGLVVAIGVVTLASILATYQQVRQKIARKPDEKKTVLLEAPRPAAAVASR